MLSRKSDRKKEAFYVVDDIFFEARPISAVLVMAVEVVKFNSEQTCSLYENSLTENFFEKKSTFGSWVGIDSEGVHLLVNIWEPDGHHDNDADNWKTQTEYKKHQARHPTIGKQSGHHSAKP